MPPPQVQAIPAAQSVAETEPEIQPVTQLQQPVIQCQSGVESGPEYEPEPESPEMEIIQPTLSSEIVSSRVPLIFSRFYQNLRYQPYSKPTRDFAINTAILWKRMYRQSPKPTEESTKEPTEEPTEVTLDLTIQPEKPAPTPKMPPTVETTFESNEPATPWGMEPPPSDEMPSTEMDFSFLIQEIEASRELFENLCSGLS